ncbi:hypothetical protein RB2260 [Rhodopirellula baltica SH 1]|uniref:Uncharacterized protein n=1 Tax=Rhodopirellula baltica (strain DSM 10527 / NCIMB 13988 / SH1) TaxID=243090 RepID=Q7UW54_RHOBA|nr:hypothetical protein RB2260 [Rhodopirellula baltica SH 1]
MTKPLGTRRIDSRCFAGRVSLWMQFNAIRSNLHSR